MGTGQFFRLEMNFLLMIGDLQDTMFYILWAGGLPPNNAVWWWMPWVIIFGTWTSLGQIILTTTSIFGTLLLWLALLEKLLP